MVSGREVSRETDAVTMPLESAIRVNRAVKKPLYTSEALEPGRLIEPLKLKKGTRGP